MSAEEGLRWASIAFAFLGSVLAAWSAASVPLKVALKLLSWWGLGVLPAKLVLEQKAFSSGALVAISLAFTSQLLSPLLAGSPGGWWILVASLALAVLILALTLSRRRAFAQVLQRRNAQSRTPAGELHDVEFVQAPSTDEEFLEVVGVFYDRKRRRGESVDRYRERLAQRIRAVAEGQEGAETQKMG